VYFYIHSDSLIRVHGVVLAQGQLYHIIFNIIMLWILDISVITVTVYRLEDRGSIVGSSKTFFCSQR
jgi:hypothetical protein